MDTLHDIINRKDDKGNFVLAPLPYTYDHLEPHIGGRTVRAHYWGHLNAYIDKVNALREKYPEDATIEEIIGVTAGYKTELFNNASQVYNHYFYFEQLNPKGEKFPLPKMQALIQKQAINLEHFKDQIIAEGMKLFGSGWVYVVKDGDTLKIVSYTGTGTPLRSRATPLIALDVWEHAYYLDYQRNKRLYIENFFEALDWAVIERRLYESEQTVK